MDVGKLEHTGWPEWERGSKIWSGDILVGLEARRVRKGSAKMICPAVSPAISPFYSDKISFDNS